jgi:hypothetical protein
MMRCVVERMKSARKVPLDMTGGRRTGRSRYISVVNFSILHRTIAAPYVLAQSWAGLSSYGNDDR